MERKHTPIYGIKGKLVSAVAMLLVAIVMVVSSTYAWFTLSTAPEVSGIQTSIGANGALEIWLNTSDTADSNYTPGNIVNLSAAKYGLQNIVLLPSQLQTDEENEDYINKNNFVMIPVYGPNGRQESTNGGKTFAGIFDNDNDIFIANSGTGVRGVGAASGMTDRELAYRNAKYAADTASNTAITTAATSLNTNGGTLAGIVIKKAVETDGSPATYTLAEIESLQKIVNSLTDAIGHIDDAYEQMIIALAASAAVGEGEVSDQVWKTVKSNFESTDLTLDGIATDGNITIGEGESAKTIVIADSLKTALAALKTTRTNVESAKTAVDNLVTANKDSYSWTDINDVVKHLINISSLTLNDQPISGGDFDSLASSVMKNGANVQMNPGSGVYADIADHCRDYSATVEIPEGTKIKGVDVGGVPATMTTNSSLETPYLSTASVLVDEAGTPSAGGGNKPFTEFYGFILDLSFRTNAMGSNLLLQTEAVDRIYEDNNNTATQGGGSYMTFAATTTEFTAEQVKKLMGCISIVFFDTATGEILGYADLDVENAIIDADKNVKAKMYMLADDGETMITTQENAVITNLDQNAAKNISVFVYLDGEKLTNADVAATAAKSVTGMMNIQFSSDAELKPMEYGDLHTPNQTTTTTTTTANP